MLNETKCQQCSSIQNEKLRLFILRESVGVSTDVCIDDVFLSNSACDVTQGFFSVLFQKLCSPPLREKSDTGCYSKCMLRI